MVKPQSSCFRSFVAQSDVDQSEWSWGEAAPSGLASMISIGDRAGSFAQARFLASALGRQVSQVSPLAAAWMMAIATAAAISTATPALSAGIGDWSYSPETGAVGFALDSTAQPKYFLMANPMRIVVDLPGSAANLAALESQAGGVFTQIRAAQTTPDQMRLVLQLAPGTVLQPGQVELTALGGGRWSLQPLLADGGGNQSQLPEFMVEGAPDVAALPSLEEPVEEPEFSLPSLAAMEAAVETEAEFVSMEEVVERQSSQGEGGAPVAVPQGIVPVADGSVALGSSQLPPAPTNLAPQSLASAPDFQAIAPTVPQVIPDSALPQLPQPRLGQAPLAFNPPTRSSLVDPAQIVDSRQLQSPTASFSLRPPAAVEPVMDPKLLSLEGQSAAALGGQTGLVLNRKGASAARQSVAPRPAPQAVQVIAPAPAVTQPEMIDDSIPFLVEFGAPLPGFGL